LYNINTFLELSFTFLSGVHPILCKESEIFLYNTCCELISGGVYLFRGKYEENVWVNTGALDIPIIRPLLQQVGFTK